MKFMGEKETIFLSKNENIHLYILIMTARAYGRKLNNNCSYLMDEIDIKPGPSCWYITYHCHTKMLEHQRRGWVCKDFIEFHMAVLFAWCSKGLGLALSNCFSFSFASTALVIFS